MGVEREDRRCRGQRADFRGEAGWPSPRRAAAANRRLTGSRLSLPPGSYEMQIQLGGSRRREGDGRNHDQAGCPAPGEGELILPRNGFALTPLAPRPDGEQTHAGDRDAKDLGTGNPGPTRRFPGAGGGPRLPGDTGVGRAWGRLPRTDQTSRRVRLRSAGDDPRGCMTSRSRSRATFDVKLESGPPVELERPRTSRSAWRRLDRPTPRQRQAGRRLRDRRRGVGPTLLRLPTGPPRY